MADLLETTVLSIVKDYRHIANVEEKAQIKAEHVDNSED